MDEGIFKHRTKQFGLRIIELVEALPRTRAADILGNQLLRAATSVGANYRAACRGKSSADVIAKLSNVEEEADEALYWLEMLTESKLVREEGGLTELMSEANEILAMTVASIKTMRFRGNAAKPGFVVVESKIQNPKSKMH